MNNVISTSGSSDDFRSFAIRKIFLMSDPIKVGDILDDQEINKKYEILNIIEKIEYNGMNKTDLDRLKNHFHEINREVPADIKEFILFSCSTKVI